MTDRSSSAEGTPWFKHAPAILTGTAAVLTALTGLVAAFSGFWSAPKGDPKPQSPQTPPTQVASSTQPPVMWRLLTDADLQGRTRSEIDLMRNEIYARHGRKFERADLVEYFSKQPWYRPQYDPGSFPNALLTDVQRANAEFLRAKLN